MPETRRVAVTGLGIISPIGQDVATYWDALCRAQSGIKKIDHFDTTGFTSRIAGTIPDFDPIAWMDKRNSRRVDRFCQMAIAAAVQAVRSSGVEFDKEEPSRCGVVIGTGIGGLNEMEEQYKRLMEKGPGRVSPLLVPKLMANAASGQVSILFGLQGPNFSTSSACASSAHSIGCAFRMIKWGEADVMVTGGSEAAITPLSMAGFCSAQALSTRNDEPERASRPFDKDRDGFVMGEGSGVLVLEEMEHAKRRGATIYAEMIGFGQSGDATHIVEPDPTGKGASLAMTAAMAEAGCAPEQISYVNAHGTSTLLGDPAETASIKLALGDAARKVAISSTKSMIGHLLGGSAGAESVATVLCIHHDTIHPTANHEEPDPACDLDYVPLQPRETTVNAALCNSFGFGGHNATLCFGKAR